jgi:hypothetical protein
LKVCRADRGVLSAALPLRERHSTCYRSSARRADSGDAHARLPIDKAALALCLSLGVMGVISPYGAGPSPGFLPGRDFWRLGAIFGLYYLLVFLAVGLPALLFLV